MSIVLLVEDDPLTALSTALALNDAGHSVTWASSAADAFAMLETEVDQLAALITDIDLGSERCGFNIADRARALRPDLPLVFATGRPAAEILQRGVPGAELISKPFLPTQVVKALSRVTARSRTARSGTRLFVATAPAAA